MYMPTKRNRRYGRTWEKKETQIKEGKSKSVQRISEI